MEEVDPTQLEIERFESNNGKMTEGQHLGLRSTTSESLKGVDYQHSGAMRAIFCGNFAYDAPQSCLENLFRMYGKVSRFDMKSGFAFVYMEDEKHAEKAIKELDQVAVGRKDCRIRVEWAKPEYNNDEISRQQETSRKSWSGLKPSKTLFVIHFDQNNTTKEDLERHFSPYGKILNLRIKKNYAFVQYECQEDATKALHATNNSKLLNCIISVEYGAVDNCRDGYYPDQTSNWSQKRGHDEVRPLSPCKRGRIADYDSHIRSLCPQKERSADQELSSQGPTNGSMNSFRSPCPQKERSADQELSTQGPTNGSMSSFRNSRQRETFGKSCSDLRPSKTLFVIHFDQNNTTTRDLESHFSPYGKILSVKIKNNYAFVQYESQEDATKALHATNNSKLLNYIISVEYGAVDKWRNAYNPDQTCVWSHKRVYDEVRSLSPCKRERSLDNNDYIRSSCAQDERSADQELSTQGRTNGPMSSFRTSRGRETFRKSWSDLRPSKTLFVIHFDVYSTTRSDIEKHFSPYGKILSIKIKNNYAFVQYELQEDATKALHATNHSNLLNCIISVEYGAVDNCGNGYNPDQTRDWSHKRVYEVRSCSPFKRERNPDYYGHIPSPCPQKERPADEELCTQGPTTGQMSSFRRETCGRSWSNFRPSKTLFVIHFDQNNTTTRDLEQHFSPYGKILSVKIKNNYAFVQYESQEDATKAFHATNNSKLLNYVIVVDYAAADNYQNGYNPDQTRDWPHNRVYDEVQSLSPCKRQISPDNYGYIRSSCPQKETFRKSWSDVKPSKTLFVRHFDLNNTKRRDLERHFSPYGKILSVKIRNNYAFVQYESQEYATKALHATNNSNLLNYIISVKYAAVDNWQSGYNPDQTGGWSHKKVYEEGLSLSPCKREKSPDHGHTRSPCPQKERSADQEPSTQGPTNGLTVPDDSGSNAKSPPLEPPPAQEGS